MPSSMFDSLIFTASATPEFLRVTAKEVGMLNTMCALCIVMRRPPAFEYFRTRVRGNSRPQSKQSRLPEGSPSYPRSKNIRRRRRRLERLLRVGLSPTGNRSPESRNLSLVFSPLVSRILIFKYLVFLPLTHLEFFRVTFQDPSKWRLRSTCRPAATRGKDFSPTNISPPFQIFCR